MRMRASAEIPKPLVPIGGRPILWHIMRHYVHYGFRDFVLPLGYMERSFKEYFANHDIHHENVEFQVGSGVAPRILFPAETEERYNVRLIGTGLDVQTGARIFRAAPYLKPGTFMLTYGDCVADVDLGALYRFHQAHGKMCTVTAVHHEVPFAQLEATDRGVVTSWREKPRSADWINGGYFVFESSLLDHLRDDPELILERGPLEELVRQGQVVMHRHHGFWQCMDTDKDVARLNALWTDALREQRNPPWKVW